MCPRAGALSSWRLLSTGSPLNSLGQVEVECFKMGQLRSGDTFRFVQPPLEALPEQLEKQQAWLDAIAEAVKTGSTDSLVPFPLDVPAAATKSISDGIVKVIEADAAVEAPRLSLRQVRLRSFSGAAEASVPVPRA